MRIKISKIKKDVSLVIIKQDNGKDVGNIKVSKSAGTAENYLKTSKGGLHDKYLELLRECAILEGRTPEEQPTKRLPKNSGLTALIEKAIDSGITTNKEILAYLEGKFTGHTKSSVYAISWERRKSRGIEPLKLGSTEFENSRRPEIKKMVKNLEYEKAFTRCKTFRNFKNKEIKDAIKKYYSYKIFPRGYNEMGQSLGDIYSAMIQALKDEFGS